MTSKPCTTLHSPPGRTPVPDTAGHVSDAHPLVSLDALAAPIRAAHAQVGAAVCDGLTAAHEAGRLLDEARRQIRHGQWSVFLTETCGLSRSTAAGYRRVYRRWHELAPFVQRAAHLPLRQALALLAAPDAPADRTATPSVMTFDPGMQYHGVRVDQGHERLAFVDPSVNPAFAYYSVVTTDTLEVVGGRRAVRRDRLAPALASCGFTCEGATWDWAVADRPWTYNEWLYDSQAHYIESAILRGERDIDEAALEALRVRLSALEATTPTTGDGFTAAVVEAKAIADEAARLHLRFAERALRDERDLGLALADASAVHA